MRMLGQMREIPVFAERPANFPGKIADFLGMEHADAGSAIVREADGLRKSCGSAFTSI
jgi:hypothetical protein